MTTIGYLAAFLISTTVTNVVTLVGLSQYLVDVDPPEDALVWQVFSALSVITAVQLVACLWLSIYLPAHAVLTAFFQSAS